MNYSVASIEYFDEEGSQQAASNEPAGSNSHFTSPQEPRCEPFQIGFMFRVGDFAGRSMAARGYRRQREYPQPPPPSKNNTRITINMVSMVSPLFGLFLLCKSVRALSAPKLVIEEKSVISDRFFPV